jgi:probable rRNA maturation factor
MPPGESSLAFRRRYAALARGELRQFVDELSRRIARHPVHVLIAPDSELASLNRRFRRKNYPADVLSFPAAGGGDVAVSYDRAKEQAKERGHTIELEVRILILHGVLHLAGYNHERDNGEMAEAEKRWRRRLALPDGLIERTPIGGGRL